MKLGYRLFVFCVLFPISSVWSAESSLSLDQYLTSLGITQEQNAGHMNISPIYDAKAQYYVELFKAHPSVKRIAEIGFCLGHSSDVYLSSRPDISLVSFDMIYYWYNDAGRHYIDSKYPGRFLLFKGDSLRTVPEFIRNNPGVNFDLIIIDGGHEYRVALQDIINMERLARPDTILIMDDTAFEPVNRAWNECIKNGLVEELERRTDSGFGWTRGRYLKK
jgi:predicted O-methyltransferase YrrM